MLIQKSIRPDSSRATELNPLDVVTDPYHGMLPLLSYENSSPFNHLAEYGLIGAVDLPLAVQIDPDG